MLNILCQTREKPRKRKKSSTNFITIINRASILRLSESWNFFYCFHFHFFFQTLQYWNFAFIFAVSSKNIKTKSTLYDLLMSKKKKKLKCEVKSSHFVGGDFCLIFFFHCRHIRDSCVSELEYEIEWFAVIRDEDFLFQ